MLNLLRAELLKQKHRFSLKLVWIAPMFTIFLVVALMSGRYFMTGAYNWWYTMLLPGSFTMFAAFCVAGEKRKNRHGLFGVVEQKKQLWMAQVLFSTGYLFATCLVFFVLVTLGGLLFGTMINVFKSGLANLILFLTFAWQMPLWMMVTEKMGKFVSVFLSLLCNFAIGVIVATGATWWIPFAIPARLMCSVIGVLPNGLPAEIGNPLLDSSVILPGILITVFLYVLVLAFTSIWFEKREVA